MGAPAPAAEGPGLELLGRLDTLLDQVESLPDERARSAATEAVELLLRIYGEVLRRVLAHAREAAPADLDRRLAGDDLVAHLLLLHGLHPEDAATRVRRALDEVRPYLRSHGGDAELVGIEDGMVHLRLLGSCSGCPSSQVTLRTAVEEAVLRAAPEVHAVKAEDGGDGGGQRPAAFVPLDAVGRPG